MHNRARKKFFRVIRLSLFMYILVFVFLMSAGNASAKLQNEQLPINIDSLAKAHGLQVSDLMVNPQSITSEFVRLDSIVPNVLTQGTVTNLKIYSTGFRKYVSGGKIYVKSSFGDSTISIGETFTSYNNGAYLFGTVKTSAVTKPGKRDFTMAEPTYGSFLNEPGAVVHLPGGLTIRDSILPGFWVSANSITAGQSKQLDIYGEDVLWSFADADSLSLECSDSRVTIRDPELIDSVHIRCWIDVPENLSRGGRNITIRQYRSGILTSSLTDRAIYISAPPGRIVRISKDTVTYGLSTSRAYLYTKNTNFLSTGVFKALASGTECSIAAQFTDSNTIRLVFFITSSASPTRRDLLIQYFEHDSLVYQMGLRDAFIIRPVAAAISLSPTWNLASLTRQCPDMRVKAVVPLLTAPVYGYKKNYFRAEKFVVGNGYWVRGFGQQTYTGDFPIYRFIQVDSGWNIIGAHDFFQSSLNAVQASPPGIVVLPGYEFSNNRYLPVYNMWPGSGYWVKCNKPGILFFSMYQGSFYPKPSSTLDIEPSWVALDFTDNTGTTISLYAVPPGDSTRVAAFELPPPPPTDAFDVRFANSGSVATIPDAGNEIHLQGEHYPVTVHCKNGTVTLQDKATGGRLFNRTISDGETVQVENPAINVLQISKAEYIAPQFALLQNYPNPFNPATTIQFSLPERMDVSVRVYSALGEQIATVFSGTAEKGVNTVQWNAAGFASGVYLYRITAPGYTATRKMLLTK